MEKEPKSSANPKRVLQNKSALNNNSAGTSMAAPPFQLKADSANAPVQMSDEKRKELKTKTISLSSNSGISEIYLKEQFKSAPAYLSAEITRLLKEMEGGKTTEVAASELLGKVENHFILDKDSSTVDLLGAKKSKYYRKKDFHHLSYPGNPRNAKKMTGAFSSFPIADAKTIKSLERKLRKEKDKAKKVVIKKEIADLLAKSPDLKKALADEKVAVGLTSRLNKIRKERRANSTKNGVMTEKEFKAKSKKDQAHIIDFFTNSLEEIPGEGGRKLYKDAKASYVKMRDAAKSDGVSIKLKASHRSLAAAKASASGGSRTAIASWSSHTLGLAIDLNLNVDGGKYGTEASTSPMNKVVKKRQSSAHKWIFVKGAQHGWFPYQNEPWHWEYNPEKLKAKMMGELDAYIAKKEGKTEVVEKPDEKATPTTPEKEETVPELPMGSLWPLDMMMSWAMRLFGF